MIDWRSENEDRRKLLRDMDIKVPAMFLGDGTIEKDANSPMTRRECFEIYVYEMIRRLPPNIELGIGSGARQFILEQGKLLAINLKPVIDIGSLG